VGNRRITALEPAVIVGAISTRERGAYVERSAPITWADGTFELFVAAPPELADDADDGSGLLAVCLPLAMRLGEDLRVENPVSPLLLDRVLDLQALYASWAPFTQRVTVHAETGEFVADPSRASVGFFSRGVDSVFMIARDVLGPQRFATCVFGDGLEPLHDPATRQLEIERARLQTERVGLPMAVVETNVRGLTGPVVRDWEDMCGAGLAFVALGLARGVRAVAIASTDCYESFEPAGTSPLLDPLFSTERVQITHDTIAFSRLDKIRWLAEHCPASIDDLKVCYEQNRSDNCGRCGKCMITMACLQVAGVLDQSSQFPHQLDFDAIAAQRFTLPKPMIDWAELARLDDDNCGGRLRDAVRTALRHSVKRAHEYETARGPLWIEPRSFRTHRMNLLLSLLLDGEPYPGLAPRRRRRFRGR
jgi:hypothetical protein